MKYLVCEIDSDEMEPRPSDFLTLWRPPAIACPLLSPKAFGDPAGCASASYRATDNLSISTIGGGGTTRGIPVDHGLNDFYRASVAAMCAIVPHFDALRERMLIKEIAKKRE